MISFGFWEEEFTLHLINVNEPPLLTSYSSNPAQNFNRLEGSSEVAVVQASDVDSTICLYQSLVESDQAYLTINATSGVLRCYSSDFETPTDSDSGNDYNVTARASDGEFFISRIFFLPLSILRILHIDLLGVSSISATSVN